MYCPYKRDVGSYLKFYTKFFLRGKEIIEIKEIVKPNNGMKFCWGINSKLEEKKDFQNSEMMFCKLFTARGGMCGPI